MERVKSIKYLCARDLHETRENLGVEVINVKIRTKRAITQILCKNERFPFPFFWGAIGGKRETDLGDSQSEGPLAASGLAGGGFFALGLLQQGEQEGGARKSEGTRNGKDLTRERRDGKRSAALASCYVTAKTRFHQNT
jgi:hypothetical protein